MRKIRGNLRIAKYLFLENIAERVPSNTLGNAYRTWFCRHYKILQESEVQVVLTPTLVGGIKPLEIGEKNAKNKYARNYW